MPVFTSTPQKGFVLPRKPEPGVNVHPDSRLAQPKQPEAAKGPHPFLKAHGFNGDIQSFNRRASLVKQGFENAYGQKAPPGLIWDVARSESVPDLHIPDLFKVPLDQRQVKAEQYHQESSWNGEGLHVRQDGNVQRTNGITAYHQTQEFHHQELQDIPHVLKVKDFQKKYPAIQMGVFPQLPFSGSFWKDVYLSQGHAQTINETVGNLSPKQLQSLAQSGGGVGASQVGAEAGTASEESAAAQNLAGQARINYLTLHPGDTAGADKAYQAKLDEMMSGVKPTLTREVTQSFDQAHQRNKQRQDWLINHDPYNLFSGLQPNGIFDKQWMVQLDKWSRTPSAANSYLQSLATQNQFDTSPQGIRQMEEALKLKQNYVNSKQALPDKWLAQSMPLRWFSNHQYPLSILEVTKDTAGGNGLDLAKRIDQSMKDFWGYETSGLHWDIFPAALLQAGFRGLKLGYNTLGGGWSQAIADTTGVTTMFGDMARGKSVQSIAKDVHDALQSNPDLVRTLGFGFLPKDLRGTPAVLDQIGNFVLQTAAALLIDGPGYFKLDETAPLGKWKANRFLWLANKVAYTQIKAGDLGSAEVIFGGQAADPFIRATEKGIQDGSISPDKFHDLATGFARDGKVTLPDGTEFGGAGKGGIHWNVRDKNMPKHVTGLALKEGIKRAESRLETWAMSNRATDSMGRILKSTRGLLSIAQPLGKSPDLYYLDTRGLKTFILQNDLAPEKDAQEIVNKYIRARAVQNTTGMEKILDSLKTAFNLKYPMREGKGFPAPFERLVETEGLVKANFPSMEGRFRAEPSAMNAILNGTDSFTKVANEAGRYWRTSILATGPGLFYKHALRDPLAAFLGGAKITQTADMKAAEAELARIAESSPEKLRVLGATRNSVIGADTVYSNSLRLADGEKEFHLMDEIRKTERTRWVARWLGPKPNKEIAVGAAEFLRNQVNSALYPLYEDYRNTRDATPMVEKVLSDRKLYAQMKEATHLRTQLNKIKREFKDAIPGQLQIPGTENALKETLRLAKKQAASAYVEMVTERWQGIDEAGRQAGMPDLMSRASQLQRDKPGQADGPLAKLLLENQVNLRVPDGKIAPLSRWDRETSTLIKAYMKPNRMARQHMFDHMTQQYFSSLVKSGYDPEQAFEVSMQAAKTATQFHLLDFSNMLEFERKYRGLLPFFTKHRLFIKWLAGTIVHRPALVGPLTLISKHLDPYLRLNFNIGNVPVNLSFARLLFLSSEQQPATVPLFNFIPGIRNSNLSSQYTRIDPLIALWGHIAFDGYNYDAVAPHLDPYTRSRLDKYMALYAIRQRMKHGEAAYVSPHDAFKWASARISADIPVNGMFLTPLGISSPKLPPEIQTLNDKYDKLLTTNPQQAQALLADHPELALAWGRTQNFNVYNHMTQMWGMYDNIRAKYSKVEDRFSKMEQEGKTLTPADYAEMRKASQAYSAQINQLRQLDAQLWNHDTNDKGEPGFPAVSPAEISSGQPYGPWYKQFSHDPIGTLDNLEKLFGGSKMFSAADLHNIYGHDLQQYEVDLQGAKDSTTRDFYIKQIQRLQGATKITKDSTFYQVYHAAYQKFQNSYYPMVEKAAKVGGEAGALLRWKAAQAMIQQYEHPVVKFKGKDVKVLPFAEYATLGQTPTQRITRLFKDGVKFSYGQLSMDQRAALKLPDATPALASAWADFEYNRVVYETQSGKTITRSLEDQMAIALNKQTPGFWKVYQMSHWPRSFILLNYGKGAFEGRYGSDWKQVTTFAAEAYNGDQTYGGKQHWSEYVTRDLYPYLKQHAAPGFVAEIDAAGGANFLINLNTPWG